MRRIIYLVALSIPIILIALIILRCAIHRGPRNLFSLYINHYDIDINSGDGRHQIYLCSFLIKNQIQPNPFSQELRRLGIPVSEKRIWKNFSTGTLNIRCISSHYAKIYGQNASIVKILNAANAPDQDRIDIMQRALAILQIEDWRKRNQEMDDLMKTVIEKYWKK